MSRIYLPWRAPVRVPTTDINAVPVWRAELGQKLVRQFDDGSTQYLIHSGAPFESPPYTISIWFNTDDDSINQTAVCIGDEGGSTNFIEMIMAGASGDTVAFRIKDSPTPATATTTTSWSANTWHNGIIRAKSATDRAVFLDGLGKGTNTTSTSPTGLDNIAVGVQAIYTQLTPFSGRLANLAIWDAALSDQEVFEVGSGKKHPTEVRPQSLLILAPLDIESADRDLSGHGFHFTPTNGPTWGLGPWQTKDAPYRQFVGYAAAATEVAAVPVWRTVTQSGGKYFDGELYTYLRTSSTPVTSLPCSMAVWFRGITGNAIAGIGHSTAGGNREQYLLWWYPTNHNVSLMKADDTDQGYVYTPSDSAPYGQWVFTGFTAFTNTEAYLYASNCNTKYLNANDFAPYSWDNITLARQPTTSGAYGTASIANLAVWNAGLQDAEMHAMRLGKLHPLQVRRQNLVGYWPLNDPGPFQRDRIGHAHFDTWGTNLPVSVDGPPMVPDMPERQFVGWAAAAAAAGNPWYAYAQM